MLEGIKIIKLGPEPDYNATMEKIKNDPTLRKVVVNIANSIIAMSDSNTTKGEHRDLFSREPERSIIRGYGEQINILGGMELMQFMHAFCSPLFNQPYDGRLLEFAWDGIGEWRC